MGLSNSEQYRNCKGFPAELQLLKCGGNGWDAKDIITLISIEQHRKLEIHTDGQPGEIIDAVRNTSTELVLASKSMSPPDCCLLTTMIERHGCGTVEKVDLTYNNDIGNEGLIGDSGLLGTLSKLPRLRELWLGGTGLDDTDTKHQIVDALAQTLQNSFAKLQFLRLDRNKFSEASHKILWKAWRSAGREDKYRETADAIEFYTAVEQDKSVEVVEAFASSNKTDPVKLIVGIKGKVENLDEDGYILIKFDGIEKHQWVNKRNREKLQFSSYLEYRVAVGLDI